MRIHIFVVRKVLTELSKTVSYGRVQLISQSYSSWTIREFTWDLNIHYANDMLSLRAPCRLIVFLATLY